MSEIYMTRTWPEAAQDLSAAPGWRAWFEGLLDALDYGTLLVTRELRLVHSNRTARQRLRCLSRLGLDGERLHVSDARLGAALERAVHGAVDRGLRSLIELGDTVASVVPAAPQGAQALAAIVLGRSRLCSALAVEAYARRHQLTAAELAVLHALLAGCRPEDIAREHGVALCTVRTQVTSIRAKAGAASLRELLARLSRLPPLLGLLEE